MAGCLLEPKPLSVVFSTWFYLEELVSQPERVVKAGDQLKVHIVFVNAQSTSGDSVDF